MIWPCNGQVFFNEIDCYLFSFIFTRHRKFRHRKTRHRKLGPSPSPASLFSVSCLKRFPDTPKIHTMVLQGFFFISIVSLSLLSNLHRRILRSAIIACALQKKKFLSNVPFYSCQGRVSSILSPAGAFSCIPERRVEGLSGLPYKLHCLSKPVFI